jgi:hypothetical protein
LLNINNVNFTNFYGDTVSALTNYWVKKEGWIYRIDEGIFSVLTYRNQLQKLFNSLFCEHEARKCWILELTTYRFYGKSQKELNVSMLSWTVKAHMMLNSYIKLIENVTLFNSRPKINSFSYAMDMNVNR